ncbi:MAG: phosphoribosyl-ATP diphosphatase [Hyphomicrobiaceae bacterium]
MRDDVLLKLSKIIRERRSASSDTSYTRQLLDAGWQRCAQKLGEEAIETVLAAASDDTAHLQEESADLLYHLLVLLAARDVEISEVLAILDARMGVSGLEEKASRTSR